MQTGGRRQGKGLGQAMWKKILAAAGGLVIGALAVLGYLAWTPKPDLDWGDLKRRVAGYHVEILRDGYGVPHIYGDRDEDVAFGLAYAHAEDDWPTIESVILLAKGRMALRDGLEGATTDYLVRLFRVREIVARDYERKLSPKMRAVLAAYADGLNLWAARHPGEAHSIALPVTAEDIVAGFLFRTPFFYGLEGTLTALAKGGKDEHPATGALPQELPLPAEKHGGAPPPSRVMERMPPLFHAGRALPFLAQTLFPLIPSSRDGAALAAGVRRLLHLLGGFAPGSNAVAVAPARSADGHTRLLVNSHQPYSGPVAWYEVRVHSREGWDMAGGIFPGSPVVLHGTNARLGWAHTVNMPDLIDSYLLVVDDPDNPTRYRFGNEWRPFTRGEARIRVRLVGPFSWEVTRPLLWSVHGPVIRTPRGWVAIRYAGAEDIRAVEQWYRMNKATDLAGWLAAMRMNAIPSLNTVYADRAGHIAFIYNAKIPRRDPKLNYRSLWLPGDDPAYLWKGYLPFSAVPKLIDPASGFIISANADPRRVTAAADNLPPEAFPAHLGVEEHLTNRAMRALALYGADESITDDEFVSYKFDKSYDPRSNLWRFVRAVAALDTKDDPLLQEAQQVVAGWSGRADLADRATALVVLGATKALSGFRFTGWKRPVAEALAEAAHELKEAYGRLDVPWGEVQRLRRGEVDLPLAGGPDALRAVYAGNHLSKDGHLIAVGGDSYIMVVDWDENGRLQPLRTVHQFGAATMRPSSPHYADQTALFAAERFKILPWNREALLDEEGVVRENPLTEPSAAESEE
ncbi:MAG: hypothetical protein D6740_07000 [Alphaproteobacteria bacterium]|nr:MAG: hypothetical protein D6740_07000 [Alphaproteobacteria bacterium]